MSGELDNQDTQLPPTELTDTEGHELEDLAEKRAKSPAAMILRQEAQQLVILRNRLTHNDSSEALMSEEFDDLAHQDDSDLTVRGAHVFNYYTALDTPMPPFDEAYFAKVLRDKRPAEDEIVNHNEEK